jgi:hypothetical protein
MANLVFQSLTAPDEVVVRVFQDIATEFDAAGASLAAYPLQGGISALSTRMDGIAEDTRLQEVLSIGTASLWQLVLNLPAIGSSLSVQRLPDGQDQISTHVQDGTDSVLASRYIGAVRKGFRQYDRAAAVEARLGPELSTFYRQREASVLRLEETAQRLIEQNTAYRAGIDVQLVAKREELDAELNARRAQLQSEYDVREQELADVREKLRQRESALNDRASTHERRELRKELKKIIEARNTSFGLTEATRRKRWPTMALFVILALSTGILTGFSAWHALTDPSLLLAVRLLLSGISFLTTMAFFIRWNDRWAQIHAEEEFRLKRLELDIDRASWVVEMALEWKEERGSSIPPDLLDRLTRNLFADDGAGDLEVRHPTQDLLSSLLGASASARIALPGGELSLDRKALRRITEEPKPST